MNLHRILLTFLCTADARLQFLFNSTAAVVPSVFLEKYSVSAAAGFLVELEGNTDVSSDSSNNGAALGAGLGVGLGLPLMGLLGFGIYKFIKDANSASGYTKAG